MGKCETIVVAVVLSVMCPLLAGVAGWWASAALFLAGIGDLTERHIAVAASAGLVAGIVMDVLWLRRWVAGIYSANLALMAVLYLPCSAIALASCMGLPLGNLLLGALAGAYVGRRAFHGSASVSSFNRSAKNAARLTAAITGTGSLFIGFLALREQSIIHLLGNVLNTEPSAVAGGIGWTVVVALAVMIMALQFWCTLIAARLACCLAGTPGGRQNPLSGTRFHRN